MEVKLKEMPIIPLCIQPRIDCMMQREFLLTPAICWDRAKIAQQSNNPRQKKQLAIRFPK